MTDALVALRERFPILIERSYFTSQCLGPLPRETFTDLAEFSRTLTVRSRCLEEWLGRMYEFIGLVERFLHAPSGSVALRDSATACQATILAALEPLGERKKIVTCRRLHFKLTRYLFDAQARRGFEVADVVTGDPWLSADEVNRGVDERTAIVALPLVSPVTGALLPIAEIARHARKMGAITVVDAYQAVGIVPTDVQALGVDVLVAGTHKWMCGGDMGLAFMFVKSELADQLAPVYPGWIGHRDLKNSTPDFEPAVGTHKFQQGSPSLAPIYTARAGLKFLLEVGVEKMRARSLELTTRIFEGLLEQGIEVTTPRGSDRRGGMLCANVPETERLVRELASVGTDVDARADAGLRIGPFPCMSEDECDGLVERIGAFVRKVGIP